MKNLLTVTTLTLILMGCGGGGGGGGGSSEGGNSTATPAESTLTTSELIVPDGFDYNPIDDFQLKLDLSSETTQRAYVSVYHQFSTDNSAAIQANYSSRIASASLQEGKSTINFTVPNAKKELLVEIWFYDGSPPKQQVFSTTNRQLIW
ncbi:hypothetical protein FCV43_12620 [Vibrio genomosp. F6]|uniref:hypothetical protein n=1 Tax=Vibrio genomosp. F6 TaxID=723172 RepID=UPI0010BDCDCA|nr:hypothetical protein [Vibrio genomosp. F6]TKF21233.1 hypothetical protein FCV43_12620 [Vibrio genomosp. F6]